MASPTRAGVLGMTRATFNCPATFTETRPVSMSERDFPAATETTIWSGSRTPLISGKTADSWAGFTARIMMSLCSAASAFEIVDVMPKLSSIRLFDSVVWTEAMMSPFAARPLFKRPPIMAPPILPAPMKPYVYFLLISFSLLMHTITRSLRICFTKIPFEGNPKL